jgi:multicomponent Na+:H+ antiporter subunit G
MNDIGLAAQILIGVGMTFDVFGCIGLLRLPDVYNRLQAATKCVTLGTCLILVGTALGGASAAMSIKAVLCAVFILLTSPVGAHAIARGAYKSGVRLWEGSVMDRYGEEKHPERTRPERAEPAPSGEPLGATRESAP